VTAGTGDLDDNGINAYVSGFYFKSKMVRNRDLPYPFNTDDQRNLCLGGVCGSNNIINGRDADEFLNGFFIGYDTYVRPYDATNTTAQGRYQLLNPTAGCQYGPAIQPTGAELATSAAMPLADICQTDVTNLFGVVSPNIERFGGSARVTAKLGDNHEGYFMVNFQQSKVDYTGFPPVIRGQANAGILFRPFSTSAGPAANLAPGSFVLTLPVYVCPTGVGDASGLATGCTAATPGAVLNPNNPFAAAGQLARIIGRPIEDPTYNETRSRVYRAAAGLTGTLDVLGDWDYRLDLTAMHNDLRRTQKGYVYIANLLTAIAQGTFNFVDPSANTQAQIDFISPDNITDASSDLYAAQVTFGRELFELPGGPLQFGFGGQIRYEAVDAPSGNPDYNGATQRFFTLNAFGTSGSRVVKSAFFEVKAPVIDMLDLEASGRYDSYSSGQSAFSPKVGARFQPIDQITLRATWSKGFRIPAFGEANALPTTGFVTTNSGNFTDSFLAQYGCSLATYANCPAYIRNNSYGLTTLASPNLDPEKSRSITLGAVFQPVRNITLTVDYFDIKKTGAITSPSNAPALEAYYSCTLAQYNGGTCAIPAGYNVIAGAADPNTPGALPVIGFIEAQLVNANTIRSRGLDFAALAKFSFGDIKWTSSLEASRILELSTRFPDGTEERYEGTLGNFNLTAGSGTPKWHGSWQNTIDWGKLSLTGTANFFGGYNLSAEDQGTEQGDCGLTNFIDPDTGEHTYCDVDDYITVDLVAQFRATEKFTFYVNVLNAFDNMPPVDPVTYGAFNYNPVQGGTGIFGRSYRAGVRVNF
jgi:iron complex outermembrane recepter protein